MRELPVFGRPAPPPDQPAPTPRPPLRVLRADGRRIDLTKRDAGNLLVATRQGWQVEAMAYRDLIGELRYAVRLLARSVAKVRFYVAETRPHPLDPAPLDTPDGEDPEHGLDAQLAADAVATFARLPLDTHPDGFTARAAENLSICGEAWVHLDSDDRFHLRSVSEITASADGRVVLNGLPGSSTVGARQIDQATEILMRIWVPHPQWGELADSPMRALLDTAEDAVLAGREQRAAARSRLAANGILFISESMSLARTRSDEDEDAENDTFMRDLTEAMLAPVSDDGDAGAVVPIVIRAAPEDIDKAKHLTFDRADSKELIGRQSAAVLRLLRGLDIQPEQVEGLGSSNHWTSWQIESQSVKHQVQPLAETIAACLAQAYLRPALISLGHSETDVDRVTIAVDISGLMENPNRGQDARDAHSALAISDDALREALGFDTDDAPDEEELVRRLASAGRLPPELTAAVLGIRTDTPQPRRTVDGETVPVRELPAADTERPAASPGETVPSRPVPEAPDLARGPDAPVVAAATPDDAWRVEVATALGDIDAALLDRITTAADAAIARVVEKAGARVRSAARSTTRTDPAFAAQLAGLDVHLIASTLGRDRVAAFVPVDDLITDAYARLKAQVRGWLTDAATATADAVVALLRVGKATVRGRRVHDTVTARLTARTDDALRVLDEVLDEAAERALFAPDPFAPDPNLPGEGGGTLIRAGEVRRVLDTAGGGNGGVGTGDTVARALGDEGGVILGYEWNYRPEIVRDTFPPHRALHRVRFATFTDPKLDTDANTAWLGAYFSPGDHLGCFIAGTEVSGPPATASFVRPYRGEGVEIRTESGKVLTGTPNHPILTPGGWIPMGELGEGDEVVVARDGEGPSVVDDEAHQVPALIEDVAAALPMAQSVVARPVPTAAEHFHGDGTGSDGQVTVVRTDSRLLVDNDAASAQFGDDDVFELADAREVPFASDGVPAPLLPGDRLAAHGGVRSAGDRPALLGRRVVVPDVLGLAPVARDDACIEQASTDDGAAASVADRQTLLAGPVDIGTNDHFVGVAQLLPSCVAGPTGTPGREDGPASPCLSGNPGPPSPLLGSDGCPVDGLSLLAVSEVDIFTTEDMPERAHVATEPPSKRGQTEPLVVGSDERGSQSGVPLLGSGDAASVCAEQAVDGVDPAPVPTPERLNGLSGVMPGEQVRETGVSSAPRLDGVVLAKDSLDRSGGYPVPASESLDRFAGGVATEKVVEVVRRPLDCHVYNLTTTTGWYIANGVIVHNCHCATVPVVAFPELDDGVVARRLREAQGDPRNILAGQIAADDDRAGRVGTSLQNEVEVRTRITTAIERLQREHVEKAGA